MAREDDGDDPDVADWDGGWGADAVAKRRAWARMTPGERFSWLEDALTFAGEHGLLDRDRQRRARLAQDLLGHRRDHGDA